MWNEIRSKLGFNNNQEREQRNAQETRSADNWQAARAGGSQASSNSHNSNASRSSSSFVGGGNGVIQYQNPTISNSGINSANTIKRDPKKTTSENALSKARHNWYADPSQLIEASMIDKWDQKRQMYPEEVAVPNKTKVTYSRLASYMSTLSEEEREAALNDLRQRGQ